MMVFYTCISILGTIICWDCSWVLGRESNLVLKLSRNNYTVLKIHTRYLLILKHSIEFILFPWEVRKASTESRACTDSIPDQYVIWIVGCCTLPGTGCPRNWQYLSSPARLLLLSTPPWKEVLLWHNYRIFTGGRKNSIFLACLVTKRNSQALCRQEKTAASGCCFGATMLPPIAAEHIRQPGRRFPLPWISLHIAVSLFSVSGKKILQVFCWIGNFLVLILWHLRFEFCTFK